MTWRLPLLALLLALSCAGIFAYKQTRAKALHAGRILPVQTCQPERGPCTAQLPDGQRLEFSIAPTPVRPLQPLQLTVVLAQTTADRIEVEFQGVDMDMGRLRTELTGDHRQFNGQAMLPICTTGTMTWSATLTLIRPAATLTIPFHFDVAAR